MLSCLANCNSEILPSSVCHSSLEVQQQCGTTCLCHDGRSSTSSATNTLWNTFQSGQKSVTQRWLLGTENVSSSTESPGPLPSRQESFCSLWRKASSPRALEARLNSIVVTGWKVYQCRGNSIKIIMHSYLEFKRALCMPNVSSVGTIRWQSGLYIGADKTEQ